MKPSMPSLLASAFLLFLIPMDNSAAGELPSHGDGWHTWQVNEPGMTLNFFAKLKNGEPVKIYVQNSRCNSNSNRPATDHGAITTEDNLVWLQAVIENRSFGRKIRENALLALVQSESDATYAYLALLFDPD